MRKRESELLEKLHSAPTTKRPTVSHKLDKRGQLVDWRAALKAQRCCKHTSKSRAMVEMGLCVCQGEPFVEVDLCGCQLSMPTSFSLSPGSSHNEIISRHAVSRGFPRTGTGRHPTQTSLVP